MRRGPSAPHLDGIRETSVDPPVGAMRAIATAVDHAARLVVRRRVYRDCTRHARTMAALRVAQRGQRPPGSRRPLDWRRNLGALGRKPVEAITPDDAGAPAGRQGRPGTTGYWRGSTA